MHTMPSPQHPQLHEPIWYDDVSAFVSPDTIMRFMPVQGMTLNEQLNAALRFAIYFAIILLIGGRSSRVLFIPILVAGGTYFMHEAAKNDVKVMREGLLAKPTTRCAMGNRQPPCTVPTRENPFMNVLHSDYSNNPERGPACDIQDVRVAKRAERLFEAGLIQDSDDIFGRKTGSRQFVTNPSTTIPNDQTAFAQWLYGNKPLCKTPDRKRCMYST